MDIIRKEFTNRSKEGTKGVFTRERELQLKNLMILGYIMQFHPTGFRQILQKSGLYDFNIKKILKVHLYRLARNKKMDLKLY